MGRLGGKADLEYSFTMPIPRFPRLMHYKLDGRRAVLCESLVEWSAWMAAGDRRVAETWIDDVRISTVFLGLDHNHGPGGDPLLFETIAFVDDTAHEMRRYFIWEEAEAGHAEMTALIRSEMEAAKVRAGEAWRQVYERLRA
ncbi:hypothetical protein RXE43_006444 [Pseudomonas aeruginosa]|uniref:hypothetical protein n=2 Tax=Pseudomonas TaxID=286 RepID=UPI0003D2BB5E|nr:hypothetical protein [Pseudomonas aeruginosa]ETD74115.1 hypothetical protein V527_29060 [Pseudomonas aeruginosa VRFPA06]EJV1369474.1 hypothetical protein [Pseudomonas aeruginosa]EJV1386269.1 hypothetical protein [Pseudomonas aeruginosa]EJV1609519.1 hypothetical protein [Pseudomonas aeruginosa]EKD1566359.1 hypothetical protein [Pseudomonas aeruginosa]